MNPILLVAIVAFVVIDVVVMLVVVRPILLRRAATSVAGVTSLSDLLQVTKAIQDEAREYLRANWSGDATTLPLALRGLLDTFEARAREQEIPVTRAELKPMLARLVLAKRLAPNRDVQEAMKQVA